MSISESKEWKGNVIYYVWELLVFVNFCSISQNKQISQKLV